MYETDVPAQCAQTRQDARFSEADVDQGRPSGPPGPAGQGAPPAHGLTGTPHGRARPAPIRSRRLFLALRQASARGRSGPVGVTFVQVRGQAAPSVGYAVGRRVGPAVVRNRLRRRIRAVVDELSSELDDGAYLVTVAPGAVGLSAAELRASVGGALRQAMTASRTAEASRL